MVKTKTKTKTKTRASKINDLGVFSDFSNSDFYSNRAQHVYFYGEVEDKNVHKFREDLFKASQVTHETKKDSGLAPISIKPKPIVIHVNSPGGSGEFGITLMNIVSECNIPLCIFIDGYCCSAASLMFIAAPVRIMHEASLFLIHEGSWHGHLDQRTTEFDLTINIEKSMSRSYVDIYENNSTMTRKMINELVQRDMFMNSTMCKEHSIVDKILVFSKKASFANWDKYSVTSKQYNDDENLYKVENYNHLFQYNNNPDHLDLEKKTNCEMKVITALHTVANIDLAKPLIIHFNASFIPETVAFQNVSAILSRLHMLNTPVVSVIDSNVNIMQILPSFVAHRRYMYRNTTIRVELVVKFMSTTYFHDIFHNTKLLRDGIKKILKEFTKIPESVLKELFFSRTVIDAEMALKYGMVDFII